MTFEAPARRRATLISIGLNYMFILLVFVQGFVLVRYYVRFIPGDVYGAWLASGNVIAWLLMVDPGFGTIIQQRIAKAYGENNREAMAAAIGTGLLITAAFAGAIGLGGVALGPLVPRFVNLSGTAAGHQIAAAFAVAAAGGALLIVATALGNVLSALMTDLLTAAMISVLGTAAGTVATAALLFAGWGVMAIPVGQAVRAVALFVCYGALLARVLARKFKVRPRGSREELRQVLGLSFFTWSARLAGGLLDNIDAFLVSRFVGPGSVPVLVLTRRGGELLAQFASRFTASFIPAVAHLHGEGAHARLREIVLRVVRISGFLAVLSLGGYVAVNRSLVGLWVGPGMYGGLAMTVFLALNVGWQIVGSFLSSTLFAMGYIRDMALLVFMEAVPRLALMLTLLAAGLGLIAPPLATATTALGIATVILLPKFGKAVELPRRAQLALFGAVAAQAAVFLAMGVAWNRFVPLAGSWRRLALQVGAMGALEVAVLYVLSRSFRGELGALRAHLQGRLRARRGAR